MTLLSPGDVLSGVSALGLPTLVTIVLLLSYITTAILAWYRLRAFRGPPTASFSYLWIYRASSSGRMGEWFTSATRRYASSPEAPVSTVRIGPNELLTSDLDVLRRMNSARSRYTRGAWYRLNRLDPYADNMFSQTDTAIHDRLKAQMAPGYAGKDNPMLESDIDGIVGQFVGKLRAKYAAGPSSSQGQAKPWLDLAIMAQFFTLDVITKLAFGKEFGYIETEQDLHGYAAMIDEVAPPMVVAASIPYLSKIVGSDLYLRLAGPKPGDKYGLGKIMPIAESIVAKRFAPDAKAENDNDMLGSFIRHNVTQRQCQAEVVFQLVAGSDTTATALRAGLLYVITSPRIYGALRSEIDEGIKTNRISSPIKYAEATQLPYLQAVIFETLRMHPPFTGLITKVVPPQGDTIDGKFVPGGTRISPSIVAAMRNPAIFGPDAEVFRPERWIEADPEKAVEMRRTADFVFGHGRFGCAGKNIAMMELHKMIVELLRHFDFQLVNPTRPWRSVNFNLWLQREMWVTVASRETPGT